MCGGRDFDDWELLHSSLQKLPIKSIVNGGARGADVMSSSYAEQYAIPVVVYPAEWDKYGKGAGHIRNARMLQNYKPDLVVAFPGGKGTANMIKIAKIGGVRVWEPALDKSN